MRVPPATPTAAFRGAVAGSFVVATSIAAHGAGGGHVAMGTALALVLAVGGAVGYVTASIPALATTRRGLVAVLLAGQVLGHAGLALAMPGHAMLPDGPMLAAHALATLACGVAVCAVERLYGPVVHVVRAVLLPIPVPTAAPPLRPIAAPARPRARLVVADVLGRGPPA
ncbi:hypothetical protein DW322_04100 [Rhodococcus rhodnii]|uniref:Uncharacterized protein n=2 Tax=Rhodococcus rhodnii TaxID=38312 RepID=R7WGU3_9NOCA|nr:hypothetical protein [Rhodococcus rhodnii]EOM74310.1 hypothetical protein Rrhod_4454 [Rhodococcus rhodnii LMG 5362]TXG89555.1 hypothetical protein DW322_04100 [Rhodococcus rhodnii]